MKCIDTHHDALVAVKLWCSGEEKVCNAVRAQYDLLSKVNHPFIIRAQETGITKEGFPYLVTEWSEKGNLRDNFDKLDWDQKLKVVGQIAEALDLLHSIGYLHGDIKLSNALIFQDEGGQLLTKLTDFEFLRAGSSVSNEIWQGTLSYLAPEIIRGEPINYSSDLYSLGILLYELLTGRLPFQEQNIYGLAYAQLDEIVQFTVQEIDCSPSELVSIVYDLLEKNPAERIDSAWKVRDALLKDINARKEAEKRLGNALIEFECISTKVKLASLPEVSNWLGYTFKGLSSRDQLAKFLHSKSDGSPKIIKAYLRELIALEVLRRTNGCWAINGDLGKFALNHEIARIYTTAELTHLSQETRRILEWVSIFKYGVSAKHLIKLMEPLHMDFDQNLDNLRNAAWLSLWKAQDKKTVKFSKGLDKDFVLSSLDYGMQQDMKRQALSLLQTDFVFSDEEAMKELLNLSEETQNIQAAYKYAHQLSEMSEKKQLPDETLRYTLLAIKFSHEGNEERPNLLLRAASTFDKLGEPAQAQEYYLQYLSANSDDQSILAETERKLGWCYARLGDFERAERYLSSAFERFKKQENGHGQLEALLDLAACAHTKKDYERCGDRLQMCEQMLKAYDSPEAKARLYKLQGVLEWYKGNYQMAFEDYSKSLRMYENLVAVKEAGAVANNIALLLRDWGRHEEALEYILKDLEISRRIGDKVSLCASYNNQGIIFQNLSRFKEGIEVLKQALKLAQETGYREGEAFAHNNLGFIYLSTSSLDKAIFHLREAISQFRVYGNPTGEALAYYNLGEIYRIRELFELASESYNKSLHLRRQKGEKLGVADCLAGSVRLCLEVSKYDGFEDSIREAMGLYQELRKEHEQSLLLLTWAEYFLKTGSFEQAEALISKTESDSQELVNIKVEQQLNLAKGLYELHTGDHQSSERHLLSALKLCKKYQDKVSQARISSHLGELFSLHGNSRLASKYWRESLGIYRELKVRPKIEKLEALMSNIHESENKNKEQVRTLLKVSQFLVGIEDEDELLNQVLKV